MAPIVPILWAAALFHMADKLTAFIYCVQEVRWFCERNYDQSVCEVNFHQEFLLLGRDTSPSNEHAVNTEMIIYRTREYISKTRANSEKLRWSH
jgi:hypothetical protein